MYLEIIRKELERRNLNWRELTAGICTEKDLEKYYGGKLMDRLTLNSLLQRLGISTSLISNWMSGEEYAYFKWRGGLLRAAGQREWKKVRQLVNGPEAYSPMGNRTLQEQFVLIIQGILAVELDNDTLLGEDCLERALQLTCFQRFGDSNYNLSLMSSQEWCALLNLSVIRQAKANGTEKHLLQNVLRHLERHLLPEPEHMWIYPFAVSLLRKNYLEDRRYKTYSDICDRAIEVLKRGCGLGQLPQLLKCAADCRIALGKVAEAELLKNQYDALEAVLNECPVKPQSRWLLTPMMEAGREIGIYGNLIADKRREKGLTREQLCAGICSEKTLMRIEKGTTVPRSYILEKLLKKLQLPDITMISDIVTSDAHVLELWRKLNQLMAFRDKQEFAGYLKDFTERIDQTILVNRQWVEMYRINLDFFEERLTGREYRQAVRGVLSQSIPDIRVDRIAAAYLNGIEILLLVQMANGYMESEDYQTSISILEGVLKYFEQYEIEQEYQLQSRALIMYNLSVIYGKAGDYDTACEVCKNALKLEIFCERAVMLPEMMMWYAQGLLKLGHVSEAGRYYSLSASLRDMVYHQNASGFSGHFTARIQNGV